MSESSPLPVVIAALVAEHGYLAVQRELDRQGDAAGRRHGTLVTARWHRRRGEPMCEPCAEVWKERHRPARWAVPR